MNLTALILAITALALAMFALGGFAGALLERAVDRRRARARAEYWLKVAEGAEAGRRSGGEVR
ncbi:hypothetical protein [Amycolatopsis viridis]|uniref:Uncharacterized protein n=1 Tax=Amycolatopsis viridis TaxID=185678 RepID=A0ABX0SXK5_9PSEU|nr:hypothetical protein [Amycolatopsis viridis]NIH81706.1 hypothetical protein [Amycolatopsis viridis]